MYLTQSLRQRRRSALSQGLVGLLTIVLSAMERPAQAQGETFHSNTTDTAWMLVSAALVMLMTPGLAMFYGGMVRPKNVLNVMMKSFLALSIITVLWITVGYSLAFAPGNAFLGGLNYVALNNTEPTRQLVLNGAALTIPNQLVMIYQLMFAIVTPALISGAVVERMKFSAYLVFIALWSLIVYVPIAHMVWGEGGYLFKLGALDFAGGTVVHLSSGISALILTILVGKRTLQPNEDTRPNNLPLTLIGAGLLWFGWFGFNAGSAGASGDLAVNAFITTHIAAAVGSLVWVLVELAITGRASVFGFVSGLVIGLVAITPGAGYIAPLTAAPVGALAAVFGFFTMRAKARFGYDDTLDVFAIHGVGGAWGTLAVALFANPTVNPAVPKGLFFGGGFELLLRQSTALAYTLVFAVMGTLLIGTILKFTLGLRATEAEEAAGLDTVVHGESGYVFSPMNVTNGFLVSESATVVSVAAPINEPRHADIGTVLPAPAMNGGRAVAPAAMSSHSSSTSTRTWTE
jgi:ammonium transporter, Amt family